MSKFTEAFTHLKKAKKSRNTLTVFAALLVVFTGLAVAFGCSLPQVKGMTDVHGQEIQEVTWTSDGGKYFLNSKTEVSYRNTKDDTEIQSIPFASEIQALVETSGDTLQKGSLSSFYISHFDAKSDSYLLVYDNMANMFKYVEGEDGVYTLTSDHFIRNEQCAFKLMTHHVGDVQYFITSVENNTMVESFDLTNLSAGYSARKYVWDCSNNGDGTHTVSHIKNDAKYWEIFASGDNLYLAQASGVFKVNLSFSDYGDFSYLETMYDEYPDLYHAQLRSDLQAADPTTYTDEKLDKMSSSDMERVYKDVTGQSKDNAKKAAKAAFLATNGSWCTDIDLDLGKVTVKDDHIDKTKYSIIHTSICTNAAKIVYFPKNDAVFVASVYDDCLYEAKVSVLADVGILDNRTMDDCATKLDLSFGGSKFAQYNPLSINETSNVAFVSFLSSDRLVMVDLSKEGDYKIIYDFTANYDVLTIFGTTDNENIHYIIYDKTVDINGNTSTFKSLSSLNPTKTKYQGFFKISMILCIVCAALCLIGAIVSFYAGTKDEHLQKLCRLGKDLKKNKWVYVALIPFVALLMLFCYYEAVGSISLSFFDYTRANPSMKWNNFANYLTIFNSGNFWLSVGNMIFFLVGDLILSIIPPLIFAFFLTLMRSKRYSRFLRAVLMIPAIIPGIAGLLIWRTGIFGEYGVLNTLIKLCNGQPVEWLANSDISRWSLLLMGFPFVGGYLIIYGGLMNIPREFYEEGELSGINVFQRFVKIDVPLVMPQLKYIFIMTFIGSVQNYSRTYMLKSSGTVTLAENMYLAMTSVNSDYGLAAAYATLIFVFLFFAVAVNFKNQKKNYLGDN